MRALAIFLNSVMFFSRHRKGTDNSEYEEICVEGDCLRVMWAHLVNNSLSKRIWEKKIDKMDTALKAMATNGPSSSKIKGIFGPKVLPQSCFGIGEKELVSMLRNGLSNELVCGLFLVKGTLLVLKSDNSLFKTWTNIVFEH